MTRPICVLRHAFPVTFGFLIGPEFNSFTATRASALTSGKKCEHGDCRESKCISHKKYFKSIISKVGAILGDLKFTCKSRKEAFPDEEEHDKRVGASVRSVIYGCASLSPDVIHPKRQRGAGQAPTSANPLMISCY